MATVSVPPDFHGIVMHSLISQKPQVATSKPQCRLRLSTRERVLSRQRVITTSRVQCGKVMLFTKGDSVGFVHDTQCGHSWNVVSSISEGDGVGGICTQMHVTWTLPQKNTVQVTKYHFK
jgi:hypothetical protein